MRTTLFLALAFVAGCGGNSLLRRPPSGPMVPGDERGTPIGETAPGTPSTTRPSVPPSVAAAAEDFTSKKVSGKEEPNVLIAADKTRCVVSEARFRETGLGESVRCRWVQ